MSEETMCCEPVFQIRNFGDGTWSVIARVWTPQKKFFEHPEYINLTENEAKLKCQECSEQMIALSTVLNHWTFIGT